ncbi:MAG: peptide chain release factor 1 [Nitrososphaerota archaeon]|nr:peptide chain release factor 1 [Nitrososphaerota archaeon]
MTTTDSVKQYKMRKLMAQLSSEEGTGMEFVSLYLPREKSAGEIITLLEEKSDSNEIKSGDRVRETLTRVIHRLKLQKEFPENGLAIFAGANEALKIQEIIPPEPITSYLCTIDDHFDLEPLRKMLREDRIVGIVAMDSKEAGFGILLGDKLDVIDDITSGVSGKSDKGGWSQRRYERERDMELTYYFHRVAEHATKSFLENQKVKALIVGGPGQTKESFLDGDYLHYELKNMLLAKADTLSSGKEGVRETVEKSAEALKNLHAPEEKKIMQRLEADMGKQDGLAICGLNTVLDALKNGTAQVALVSDNTDMIEIIATCKRCAISKTRIVDVEKKVQTTREMISSPCESCKAAEYEVDDRDIIDVLEDAASQTDAKVEVISRSEEDKARLKALGGFAALLRYRV